MLNQEWYDRFAALWQGRKPRAAAAPGVWDNLAADWEASMKGSRRFRENMRERIDATVAYLKCRGALEAESRVLDIGCGPGLFSAEFAKTAKDVIGIDISPRMLDGARENTEGLHNVSFSCCDFRQPEAAVPEGPYDLVFACITPAVSGIDSFARMMSLSRRYCFYSSFVHWYDDLEKGISEDVFDMEYRPSHGNHDRIFFAGFNLLWLQGYQPEVSYYRQSHTDRITDIRETALRYARVFSGDRSADEAAAARISKYLASKMAACGELTQRTEYDYGRLLWDVNVRTERSAYADFT